MPRRRLGEETIKEIKDLRSQGLSIGEIAKKAGVNRKTVLRYTSEAKSVSEEKIEKREKGVKAYLEVWVEAGHVKDVLDAIRQFEGVKDASSVTGHCDIIATIKAAELGALSEIVTEKIHKTRGIIRTETLMCVE